MKTKISIFIAFCILCLSSVSNQKAQASSSQIQTDSIRVFSSPDLYSLASNWVYEYGKLNKDAKIKILKMQDNQTENAINSDGSLYFVSDEFHSKQKSQSAWKMVVGVNVQVPIVSSKNPFLDDINAKGASSEKISQLFKSSGNKSWGALLGVKVGSPVNFYVVNNTYSKSELANFLKMDPNWANATIVENEEMLVSSIQKDPYGIGFCQIASVLDPKTNGLVEGISLMPIDKNGNGKIDNNEMIYNDLNTLLRGVWIGKFPKELCENIYMTSAEKPTNDGAVAFLSWVINDGQQYLNTKGYVDLAFNVRQANVSHLTEKDVVQTSNTRSVLPIAATLLVVFVALFFIVDYAVQRVRRQKNIAIDAKVVTSPFINEESISVLDGLYFDKSHTWAFMERDGLVSIGIDDFLQHVTGPITRIKMKNPGEEIRKGEPFLTIIQDGKQLNISAPVTGKVMTHNEKLLTNSSLLNSSPYSEGWIYRIEATHWLRDTQFLIIARGYREWIKMEFLHLKDFLAVVLRANYADNTQIVLQDGGEINDGVLKDLKPEVWEDFQTHFLNSSK